MSDQVKRVRGVSSDDLKPFIEWLDSKQEPDAYVSQFGVGRDVGDFHIYIAPRGPSNQEGSVMVFTIRKGAAKKKKVGYYHELTNGITPRTRNALQRLIEQLVPVHSSWNGIGKNSESCSFHVAKDAGPDVERAYQNYHDRSGMSAHMNRPFVKGLDGASED